MGFEKEEEIGTHVDDFIDYGSSRRDPPPNEDYARWVLNHFRLSASMKYSFDKFMVNHKLYCEYEGAQWRVTGASRLGDIWLLGDFSRSNGYDLRVCVDDCSSWAETH